MKVSDAAKRKSNFGILISQFRSNKKCTGELGFFLKVFRKKFFYAFCSAKFLEKHNFMHFERDSFQNA